MKYYLKKFIPLYIAGNFICLGYLNKPDNYFEISDTIINRSLFKKLLSVGVDINIEKEHYDFLKKLFDIGFLTEAPYLIENRNELFFDYIDKININEIKEKRILIFGIGGGGGTLTYLLAQLGFQNLYVVDNDIINYSDIERLLIFDRTQVGINKVDGLKARIFNNFEILLNTISEIPSSEVRLNQIICDIKPDLVIKACDPNLNFQVIINKICFNLGIPYLNIAYSYEFLKIGPLYLPKHTKCSEYFNIEHMSKFGNHYSFNTHKNFPSKNVIHPSASFNINILANLALKEIVFFLSNRWQMVPSLGKLLQFCPITFEYGYIEAKCKDNCIVCGTGL